MPTLQPEPESHPVPRATAPWQLKAESYIMFLRLKELPKGVYDRLEETWGQQELGLFTGGLGAVLIIRYSDTPVGPYDELLLVPGSFTTPQPTPRTLKIPKKALRISRIYVSQRTTAYNGRLNWNIPKHLARFSFSSPPTPAGSSPPSSLAVRVFPPDSRDGDATPPFFAAKLTPWRWAPAIPINTAYVPINVGIVQPPCPEPAGRQVAAAFEAELKTPIGAYNVSAKNEEALVVGTERWCAFDIGAKSWARGCWVDLNADQEENEAGEAEGKWWPKGLKPWCVGGWLEDGVFDIGKPLEWKL
ncbi:hypothetical protein GQ44DRAFT_675519 [Phaeosphaeriaceae sp. PMI808]|nr:hypothetical protein GQ44DRAFT_675519 [Phaeosphaeriaceae sp. PMI808]